MSVSRIAAAALAAGLSGLASNATAAEANELDQVKRELAELRQAYDARLHALEKRIAELQAPSSAAPATAAPIAANANAPSPPAPPSPVATGAAAATAFNPALSLILAGRYANLSRDPERYRLQGFIPPGGEVGPGRRGFSIDESELGLSASIDPTFSGQLTASFGADNSVGVEEAWFQGAGLVEGGNLRVGRFLSGIGYLNEHHAHAWDFVDAPLVYQAFFGGQVRTDGLQLRWVAPLDRFVELGAEIGSSDAASTSGRNGIGSAALFAHVGDDIGESASWRAGVSLLGNRGDQRRYDDVNAAGTPVGNAFSGSNRIWGVDGIYKWAPDGNSGRRNLVVQGEYFQRRERGNLVYDTLAATGASTASDYRATQNGWYLQAAYQFMPRWRVGARYDRLDSGAPQIAAVASGALSGADFPTLRSAHPSRTSLMFDFSPSEFSRFRVQLGADRSDPSLTDRQIFLQYIMSLGAHGAHTF